MLQHGLLCDASSWLLNTASQSLALTLATRGYDVWLANSRGTRYGLRHKSLAPDESKFWDFSFEEMASYDLPAVIDFITNSIGKSLHFVGHSQGGMMPLVALNEQPRLAHSFASLNLLAPAVYINHEKAPLLRTIARFLPIARILFGIKDFGQIPPLVDVILKSYCTVDDILCAKR